MFSPQSIVYAWDNGLRYALALLEDLTDEQMLLRPGGNMNHPAWILGHMSLYYPIVPALLRGESFPDPADDDLFGFRGRGPQDELALYGTKASQLDRMTTGHEQVAQALLTARRVRLPTSAEPPALECHVPDRRVHAPRFATPARKHPHRPTQHLAPSSRFAARGVPRSDAARRADLIHDALSDFCSFALLQFCTFFANAFFHAKVGSFAWCKCWQTACF